MKTLDEVIKALEECMADDAIESEGFYLATDALHYLKNYRDSKAWIKLEKKNYTEAVKNCEQTEARYVKAVLDMYRNEPLTWDELKEMTGKPVWIDAGKFGSHWYLIEEICPNETIICLGKFHESITLYHEDILTYWQAYRKERV